MTPTMSEDVWVLPAAGGSTSLSDEMPAGPAPEGRGPANGHRMMFTGSSMQAVLTRLLLTSPL